MSVQRPNGSRLKAVCSVSDMARAVSLSRASFYAYIKRGVFLMPLYTTTNKRPCYTAEMQQENLAARASGIGVNGEYVLFYEKRQTEPTPPQPQRQPRRDRSAVLLDSLKGLGLDKLTQAQVDEAIAASFPEGIEGVEDSVVLRVLNRNLRRSGHA